MRCAEERAGIRTQKSHQHVLFIYGFFRSRCRRAERTRKVHVRLRASAQPPYIRDYILHAPNPPRLVFRRSDTTNMRVARPHMLFSEYLSCFPSRRVASFCMHFRQDSHHDCHKQTWTLLYRSYAVFGIVKSIHGRTYHRIFLVRGLVFHDSPVE